MSRPFSAPSSTLSANTTDAQPRFVTLLLVALASLVLATPALASTLGLAQTASVSVDEVTLDLYIENLEAVDSLTDVEINNDLDAAFGGGNYLVIAAPSLEAGPNTLTLNPAFNGGGDPRLVLGGTLAAGATVQVRVVVQVFRLIDVGMGFGVVSSQASGEAMNGGGLVTDLSDNGTDPDPGGNGDAADAGEDDPTPITLTPDPSIGAAKAAAVSGRQVTFEFTIRNLGNVPVGSVMLTDDLDASFGAGNYFIVDPPALLSGPPTLTLNAGFDGSGDPAVVSGGTINGLTTIRISLVVELTTFVDLGMGVGVYANQATVTADFGGPLMDLSDAGTDPDPNGNGNPGDAGEDDPTPVIFFENPILGAAKSATLDGTQVTFDIALENFGNVTLSSLSVPENLDAVFGAGNYTLLGPPILVDDPGTITPNPGFDGSSDTQLISSGTLVAGDTAILRIVIDVTNIVDLGSGLGVYSNQVNVSGRSPGGREATDLSDNGTEPDANGDGDPTDTDENDPTVFAVGQEPQIGVAKDATVVNSDVTFDFYLENLGNVELVTLTLTEELDPVFGAGNYQILSGPSFVDDPGTITLDASFDGDENTALITSGTLAIGDTAQIRVVVRVTRLTDQGLGLGNYTNQVTVFATTALGANTSDVSDDGTDPDPNGNGDPTEAGENDATIFTVGEFPVVGVSKQVTVVPAGAAFRIVVDLTLENLGNVPLTNLTLVDDLNAVYGAGNFIHTVDPIVLVIGDGSVNGNVTYNGSTVTDVIIPGGNLGPGSLAEIRFEHLLVVVTDQGLGLGVYSNQATGGGQGPSGGMTTDLSNDGNLADPNQNGDPTDAGEDDPTIFLAGSQIGVAKDASVTGSDVTIDLYLETFGTATISELSLVDNLAVVFGVDNETMTANYTITTPPFLVDDPGTINLNPGFDGNADQEILAAGSTLVGADTAQIRFVVRVDKIATQSTDLGVYTNQVQVAGDQPTGQEVFDLSDAGTDPDPNGNGSPSDFGENDPTGFTITTDAMTGVAKTALVGGSSITLDFYLENFGTMTSTNLALVDDLDAVFGAGNYTITTPPSFVVDPGTLVLDGSYDGSANTNILTAASTLVAGVTAQIQMVVNVTNIVDSQGLGVGVYSNQAMVTGQDSTGLMFMDLSDDNTDPDINGDGDPTFPGLADPPVDGEDDPTRILLGGTGLGTALHSFVDGNFITYDYYFENLGETTITDISATQTLFTVFGFGDYSVVQTPVLIEGPATIVPESGFEGTFATTLVFGGSLEAGERARIRFVIEVTDAAMGPAYTTQFTAVGLDPIGNPLSDTSDDGIVTDPNGNGDASDAGENDATLSILGTETVLGVAKDVNAAGAVVTIDLYLENLGNNTLTDVTLEDDLDAVFGAGNYTLTTPPAFIDDPGTLTLDGAFDGSANIDLLVPGTSTLVVGDTAQIRFVVTVNTLVDLGSGVGVYSNQVIATGLGTMATVGADRSDAGTDPDPNGNGNPADAGEGDPNGFTVSNPVIGVSKIVSSVTDALVAFDFFVENLGNEDLVNVALFDDLDATFGAGNYAVAEPPFLVGSPREIVPNPNFDGSSDQNLFDASSELDRVVVEQIRLLVRLTNRTDQGLGLGNYENQASATGVGAISGAMAPTDLSDFGTDPDPSGNDNPGDAGEADPTPFSVGEIATVGAAKTASSNGFDVTFDVFLEHFGNSAATAVTLTDDLDAAFGAGNYTVSSAPVFVVDPGTLVLNGGFNGSGDTAILAAGSTMTPGALAQIQFVVTVTNVTDQGLGMGLYENQAAVTSTSGGGIVDNDLSDDGTDPDPDGDFGPDEAGENDPTLVILGALIGDMVWDDRNGDGVVDPGEPGIDGVTLFLDLDDSGAFEMGEPTTVTAGGGLYQFRVTDAGTYTVFVDDTTVPTDFVLTTANNPTMVTVGDGENFMDADFGYRAQADLSLLKADSPDPVTAGNNVTYSLTVQNAGPNEAPDATVFDLLPEGTTYVSDTAGCTQPADLEGLRALLDPANEVPPVASTASGSATFVLDTTTYVLRYALHVADIDNILLAHIHAGAAGVNGAIVQVLYDGTPLFDPTAPITGRIQLTEMEAMDLLANPHYVNVHTSDFPGGEIRGQIVAATNTPLACPVPAIPVAGDQSFDIVAATAASLPNGSSLENVAIAISSAIDPTETILGAPNGTGVLTGATAKSDTAVNTSADLSLSKSDSADPAVAGTNLTYTVEVSNAGPSDAQGVVVTDTLPAGVVLVSTSGCAEDPTGVPTCTLGTVAAGATASYTITVAIDAATLGTITNNASVATSTTDPNSANDTTSEDTLVTAQTDISVTKVADVDPVTAGQNLTYTVTLTNSGPSNATGVAAIDTLPTGTTFVSSPDGCVEAPVGTVTCTAGALAVGAMVSFDFTVAVDTSTLGTISNTVTATSATNDPNSTNDTFMLDTAVQAESALTLTKSDSPDPVNAGSPLTYSLSVANAGPSDATGTMVYDLLPDGATYQSDTAGCTQPGDLEGLRALLDPANEVPPVASTASGSASFVLDTTTNVLRYALHVADIDNITAAHIHAGAAGVNGAVVQVLYNGTPLFDPTAPISGRIQLTAMEAADLLANPHYVNVHTSDFPGGEIRGQIVATAQTPLACDLGSVAAAGNSGFDIVTTSSAMLSAGAVLDNVAIVDSAAIDPNAVTLSAPNGTGVLRGDTAQALTTVSTEANLSLTKTDNVDPAVAGTNLTYTLTVTNGGPSDAQNVVVTDTLPAGVTLVSTSGCAEDPMGVPTCTLGTLAGGGNDSYTVTVAIDPGTLGTITNSAQVTTDTDDPGFENDFADEDTLVIAETDLSVSKVASDDPATAGANLTYTLTVANAGPSNASGVVLTDTLPADTGFVSSPDGCVEGPVGTVTCNVGGLAAGANTTRDIVVLVNADVLGTISNNVVVTGTPDPNAANDSFALDTTVEAAASLALTKSDDPDPVVAGGTLTYGLSVLNNGPSVAGGTMVYDLLPDGATFQSATAVCTQPAELEGLRALLDPANEVPPVASSASGSASFVLDTNTNVLRYAIHVADISDITAAHIHAGAAGVNGAVVQVLYDGTPLFDPSNPITGRIQLTAMEAADLLGSPHYVNVHTSDFPGGEIRGQIVAAVQTPVACDLGAVNPATSSDFDVVASVDASQPAGSSITNVAIVDSAAIDPNEVMLSAPNGTGVLRGATAIAETAVIADADLSVTKTDDVDPVVAGTGLTYTIEVSNAGPSDAQNVVVTDTLPGGVTLVATSGCVEDPNGVPTCTLGTIAAGGSASYTVMVTVDSGTLGTIQNNVSVASDTNDSNSANDMASEDTQVIAEADLAIAKGADAEPATAGTNLTYTLTVSNAGPSDATSVVATDTLPAGTSFVSSPDGCVEGPVGTVTCNLGTIAAGGMASADLVVAIDPSVVGTITNNAAVSSATTDNNAANDTTSLDTTVEAVADLALAKTDDVDPVAAGTNLVYTLTVTNAGPSTATAVSVAEMLPTEVTLVATTGCVEDPGGVPTCTLGTILPGAMAQYTVEVAVDAAADGTITNTATVSTAVTDPNAANDTATEDTLVTPLADLAITKIDSKDPVAPGDTLTYTIDVTNLGPSVAPNVVVTDTLPSEVTLVSTSGCSEDPNGVPTCSLGDIAVDDTVQFTIEVTIDLGTPTGTITNTATVASDAADPDPANDTASEDTEVDADAPTVTLVDSLAGDGEIEECEEVRSSITQLLVSFSEPVQDPAGDSDADDVTNPANYLLVEAGPDRDFTTTDCSGAAGDDGTIGITGVTYDDGTDTATLTLDVLGSLGDDLYRLLVCGSTSIRDIAGNPLDGDDDGTGGDDFVRTYRVERLNPFINGHFDCTIDPWVAVTTLPTEAEYSSEDIDDSSVSGSAELTNLSSSTDFSLGQCIPLAGNQTCRVTWNLRLDAAPGVTLSATRVCEFFDAPACGGSSVGADATTSFLGDSGFAWLPQELLTTVPSASVSALCSFDLRTDTGESFNAYLDDVRIDCSDALFTDGFESGDTSAWSTTNP